MVGCEAFRRRDACPAVDDIAALLEDGLPSCTLGRMTPSEVISKELPPRVCGTVGSRTGGEHGRDVDWGGGTRRPSAAGGSEVGKDRLMLCLRSVGEVTDELLIPRS